MASKRAFFSISRTAARLSPAPASVRPPRHLTAPSCPPPATAVRYAHSIPRPRNLSPFTKQPASSSLTQPTEQQQQQQQATQPSTSKGPPSVRQQPHYELTFTCRPCGHRSRHVVSKQGYHHGSVLIACPGCRNRHVISDHLRIFGEKAVTVEDILRSRGELVKRGVTLVGGNGEDGQGQDLEFWDDGTTTVREPWEPTRANNEAAGKDDGDNAAPPGSSFPTSFKL